MRRALRFLKEIRRTVAVMLFVWGLIFVASRLMPSLISEGPEVAPVVPAAGETLSAEDGPAVRVFVETD